jgi:hypothetical protein
VAVRVALWSLAMVPVVTLKVAEVAAAGTVTDAGTVRVALVLERVTAAPPVGAALVKVTVQVELPELLRVAGRHVREVTAGKTTTAVTVPPVAESRMAFPAGEDAAMLPTPIEVVVTPSATVRFRTATVPFEMMPPFIPEATQVYAPAAAVQLKVLPAAVTTAPALAEMDTTLAGG